jgi:hypothetical protein
MVVLSVKLTDFLWFDRWLLIGNQQIRLQRLLFKAIQKIRIFIGSVYLIFCDAYGTEVLYRYKRLKNIFY